MRPPLVIPAHQLDHGESHGEDAEPPDGDIKPSVFVVVDLSVVEEEKEKRCYGDEISRGYSANGCTAAGEEGRANVEDGEDGEEDDQQGA